MPELSRRIIARFQHSPRGFIRKPAPGQPNAGRGPENIGRRLRAPATSPRLIDAPAARVGLRRQRTKSTPVRLPGRASGQAREGPHAEPLRAVGLAEAGRRQSALARRRDLAIRDGQPARGAESAHVEEDPGLLVNVDREPGAQRKVHAGCGEGRAEPHRRKPVKALRAYSPAVTGYVAVTAERGVCGRRPRVRFTCHTYTLPTDLVPRCASRAASKLT